MVSPSYQNSISSCGLHTTSPVQVHHLWHSAQI